MTIQAGAALSGPYDSQREAAKAAKDIYDLPPGNRSWTVANQKLLLDACAAAGVYLKGYDHEVIAWLAGFEPSTCAVIAGLITRAGRGGQQ